MTSATGRGRGFTLVELLFVILIIGVMIGVSVPKFRNAYTNLEVRNFAHQVQTFVSYLRERAIVERKIISLTFDADRKEVYAQTQDPVKRLKTYSIPEGVTIQTDKKEIFLYPDGKIDAFSLTVSAPSSPGYTLSTQGVYGGVKVRAVQ